MPASRSLPSVLAPFAVVLSLAVLCPACPKRAETGVATAVVPDQDGSAAATGAPAADASPASQGMAPSPAMAPPPPPRQPQQIREEGNHLLGQGSVYLEQHAYNPLDWYPWGEEALERAREEDKPIFLSIGYSSCHWCHVMEHEVFAHDDVAAYMNEHFVCIKVDREERPDIDSIYMDAVVSMTGRGGWPMTVLLTPSLKPFFGGTYFPKAKFMRIVTDALDRFRSERESVESEGDRVYARIARVAQAGSGATPLSGASIQSAIDRSTGAFDLTWGGFRSRMKFPTPTKWRFLLRAWRKSGDEELEKGVRLTLDKMADGGLQDHVGGGFHRYTTEATWLVPHFEKMLYDNGQLATLYLEAAAAFEEPRYLEVARDTLEFMLKEMYDAKMGGFYGSYDADSGGEEGTFYVWTPRELRKLAGDRDGEALALLLGVTPQGNFEHRTSILTRRATLASVGQRTERPDKEIADLWRTWRPKLYEVRAKRVWPGLDKKVVTSWNGLAIGAFARGYSATGERRYLEAAQRSSDYLWRVHRRPEGEGGGLYRASNEGKGDSVAVLDDYAFLAVGLLDLFEASGDMKSLDRALTLVAEANKRFRRGEHQGWYFTETTDRSLIHRPFEPHDSVRPSGNSAMLDAELRLAALLGEEARFERVSKTLAAYSRPIGRAGTGMAGWLDVAMRLEGPFYEVVIAGDADTRGAEDLRHAVSTLAPSWAVRANVPAAGPDAVQLEKLPPLAGKQSKGELAQAYVCVRGACKRPTTEPKALRKQILDGWKH